MKDIFTPQTIRIITGGAIILFGVATLLGSLGLYDFGAVFGTWWPLLIIFVGLLILASNTQQYIWGLIVILVGVLWQLEELDVIDFNVWQLFWPLVIIAVGWSVISNRSGTRNDNVKHGHQSDMTVFLGGIETKNDSKDYRGGKISTVMGGGTLDLRHAVIKKEATIEVFTLMGGVELRVPEGWKVQSSVMPILGGVENKTMPTDAKDAPVLNIVGTTFMGGIEVKN